MSDTDPARTFYVWDNAVRVATDLARVTGVRYRVSGRRIPHTAPPWWTWTVTKESK